MSDNKKCVRRRFAVCGITACLTHQLAWLHRQATCQTTGKQPEQMPEQGLPRPWNNHRSGAFSFLRPGRALPHSTSGAGGRRRQGPPTSHHLRGVVSIPGYIAPPYRGSNGDPVAQTTTQPQGRTLGNGLSSLIPLLKNFSKKKFDLFTNHFLIFSVLYNQKIPVQCPVDELKMP